MAFFDDIGKAISDAGQSMAQRGRNFSDSNKFNSMITNEERSIALAYSELGRLYIEKYEGNYNDEMVELVNRVKESEARIEDYRKRVQQLRNVQTCPQCGLELKKGDMFCPSCGCKMPEIEPMAPMGMPPFNAPMNGMPMQPFDAAGAQAPQAEGDDNVSKVFCRNCGSEIEAGNKFCMKCGTPAE